MQSLLVETQFLLDKKEDQERGSQGEEKKAQEKA